MLASNRVNSDEGKNIDYLVLGGIYRVLSTIGSSCINKAKRRQ
jgi:hypothetical protein